MEGFITDYPYVWSALIFCLGLFISNYIGDYFSKNRILREQKAQLLRDLVATRSDSPQDQKAAEAINYLPILFSNDWFVMKAYEEYRTAMDNEDSNRSLKFAQLIKEIALNVGINHSHLLLRDPILSIKVRMEDDEILKKWDQFKQSQ